MAAPILCRSCDRYTVHTSSPRGLACARCGRIVKEAAPELAKLLRYPAPLPRRRR